jgi:hypothetical protein
MFLRCNRRRKDGKEHRYWSLVENRRCGGGQVVQRPVLYLGEINDSQRESWCRTIEAFDPQRDRTLPLALFPADRPLPEHAAGWGVQVHLDRMDLHRPRQWGACWLACELYEQLGLDHFWAERLPDSRQGTCWRDILQTLVCYRLIDPGSEWRLHRLWFEQSAMGDLLGRDYGLVEKNALYRTLDKVLKHKQALFSHLQERWKDLFGAKFDVLLYDLTSTYFESPPADRHAGGFSVGLRGVARQHRRQNHSQGLPQEDRRPIRQSGAHLDNGSRHSHRGGLVGTPKGRLNKLESQLLELDWQAVRPGVDVKLLPHQQELYVLARSRDRVNKERAMRRRQLKALWKRLIQLRRMRLTERQLLLKLGEARGRYRVAWRLLDLELPTGTRRSKRATFSFRLNRDKLRAARRREGRYLLRTNLSGRDPAQLWQFYIRLTEIEAAFKNLKDDLNLRPIYHQLQNRIEAHIFVAFIAYCLHVTLRARLRALAGGLTPRAVLDKFAQIQMLDVHFPTTDGRTLILSRYTQPQTDHKILLDRLDWILPKQPPPRITAAGKLLH